MWRSIRFITPTLPTGVMAGGGMGMASGIGHDGLQVGNRWRAHAWLLPAVLGAAVTALLLWSAWITARSTTWPDLHHAWWWTMLAPNQDGTLAVTSALW